MSWSTVAFAAGTLLVGVVYGVFAGRHNLPPAEGIVVAKNLTERLLWPTRRERRTYWDSPFGWAVPCPAQPIVLLAVGQSNAANSLSDPVDADPAAEAFVLWRGQCHRLADPLPGATDTHGSLWTPLGQALARTTGRPVLVVAAAAGGSTLADWTRPGSRLFAHLLRQAQDAATIGRPAQVVLWLQGEADAKRGGDVNAFAGDLEQFAARVFAELPLVPEARLIVYRTSLCHATPRGNPALREAQTRVAGADPRLVIGPDTDRWGARHRADGCHFNARGRNDVVADSLAVLLPLFTRETGGGDGAH